MGRLFTDQLLKAADRGVRVRLLVDYMDLSGRDIGVVAADSHPNSEIRIFNPFSRKTGRFSQFVTRVGSVTRRMHNKSFTVNNQISVLGGRNIGNEYFDADPHLAFVDQEVLAIGPVAKELSASFDQYWNRELAYPVSVLIDVSPAPKEIKQRRQKLNDFIAAQTRSAYLQSLENSTLAHQIRNGRINYYWGEAEVVYDQPEKILHDKGEKDYRLVTQLGPYLEGIEKELIIISPYFVPGKAGTAFLTQLAKRDIHLRILTNSLASTEVGIVHTGYSKYRIPLLRAGVELYEMNKKRSREQRKEKKGLAVRPRPVCMPNRLYSTAKRSSSAL